MWLICLTLLFCMFIDFLYSLSVFFFTDNCSPQHIKQGAYDTIDFLNTFFILFFWIYPVLYVFWPGVRVTRYEQNYEKWIESRSMVSESETISESSFRYSDYKKQSSFLKLDRQETIEIKD